MIYSIEGFVYYFAILALIFIGLCAGNMPLKRRPKKKDVQFGLTRMQLSFLVLMSLVSLACGTYLIIEFLRYYGTSYALFGGIYSEFSFTERGIADKIATVFMQAGTAAYLIYAFSENRASRSERAILFCGFWTTGVYYLIQGMRFASAVEFILFLCVMWKRGIFSHAGEKMKRLSSGQKVLIVVGGLALFAAFLALFDSRAIYYTAIEKYEYLPGDQEVREMYLDLYNATGGRVSSLFFFADYVGEAPYVFSYLFSHCLPDQLYVFPNALRSLEKVLSLAGISIITSTETVYADLGMMTGKYGGFAWPLIEDFGVVAAPLAAFVFGLVCAKVEKAVTYNPLARVVYPCLFVIVAFSPIYYLTVGRMDYILLWIFILWGLMKLLGSGRRRYSTPDPEGQLMRSVDAKASYDNWCA